ncbi:hypothetical protein BJ912DRAFT_957473 [Pholiota molesta]|nr:hypothetical protein BJ912DRAFT_957473 [Pholiota molesta]
MGGSAFSAILAASAFPRLPPAVYQALKASILPRISQFYAHVTVPLEAPEKVDHGDLDLLVTNPKPEYGSAVPHETSNYAVPIKSGEWGPLGHAIDEQQNRADADDGEIYYQVDVHVCSDKSEYDRISFFHSYGDMGMILGCYKWAISSKYFDPSQFRSTGPGITKVKAQRTMYSDFVEWALIYFNKKEEYETLAKTRSNRMRLKECFSGHQVRDWTELGEYWKGVKLIMDEVRTRLGGEDGNNEESLRQFVLQVQADLESQVNAVVESAEDPTFEGSST